MPNSRFYISQVSFQSSRSLLYIASFMLLFWSIFDGIVSYATPNIIINAGYSATALGFIYASSSVSGAIFDLLLSKAVTNVYFRRMYLLMFIICFLYPILLWNAKSLPAFLLAMAIWGLYYDLKNFGTFDFVSRNAIEEDRSGSFGILGLARISGYLVAPLIIGLALSNKINHSPIYISLFFLFISFCFFLLLTSNSRKSKRLQENNLEKKLPKRSIKREFKIIKNFGKLLFPVLFISVFLSFSDAFFWTIGPLYSEKSELFQNFSGALMVAYLLPSLIAYLFVGKITRRYGKKRTAFVALIIGSAILTTLWFTTSFSIVIPIIFFSSLFSSLAWPAISGSFADYLSETSIYDKEIESITDLSANAGYIIGPLCAGILFDSIGLEKSFAVLGVLGIILCLALFRYSSRKIIIPKKID